MKQTKYLLKTFLVAIAIATTGTAMAQVDVGFRAGLNLSNLTIKDPEGRRVDGAKLTPGFHAGVTFDIPIAEEFAIQPGALFSMKGAKLTGDADGYIWGGDASYPDEYTRLNTYNLEVPINFVFKPALGSGNLLIGAGPYFSYALGGNYKMDYDGQVSTGKIEFENDNNNFSANEDNLKFGKPFDAGANLLFGYEFANRFSVQMNGQLGMLNLAPKYDGQKPEEVIRNNSFGVSVGYKF